MEDEENIQDLKNGIIARNNIIELYRKKYNDPLIESEIQKLQANENQFRLLKDSWNPNKDNIISELKLQIENLQKENDIYKTEMDKNKIYKEQIEQVLKQHCDIKFTEIYNKLKELLEKKIEFFLKKHEKQSIKILASEQDNGKVKDLQDFILNLKREIDNKVINFNHIGAISSDNSILNSISNNQENCSINASYMEEVSYECLNKSQLILDIYEGKGRGDIEIILKNNGKNTWLNGRTKLSFERESKINGDDIILRQQKPGEIGKYKIILKVQESSPPGQYHSYLGFYVGENQVGETLNITINIKKKLISNENYL
jgi:hypothetical protein